MYPEPNRLTVRLLVAGSGAGASELLGLASAGVGHEEGAVVGDQDVLDLSLGSLINICKASSDKTETGRDRGGSGVSVLIYTLISGVM